MNILREYNRIIPKKCPVCGTQRKGLFFKPVISDKTRTTIHVLCSECLTAIVFYISQSEMGLMTIGVLTDLNSEEVKAFFGDKPVSSNDIIDMYEYLNNSKENILVINNK